jgi:thioredoxin 1
MRSILAGNKRMVRGVFLRVERGFLSDERRKDLMATAVTESTFEQEVLRSEEPVLVDFWAEWCGPCHAVSPILDRIADERGLKLVKVNIDEEQELSIRYGIQSIPAMVLFKAGEPAAATIGARPKGQIEQLLQLDELVGPKAAA